MAHSRSVLIHDLVDSYLQRFSNLPGNRELNLDALRYTHATVLLAPSLASLCSALFEGRQNQRLVTPEDLLFTWI